jgi:LPXTG-site transpeptidase (sortase) family protein
MLNNEEYSTAGLGSIIVIVILFLGVHVGLSSLGLVPTEVSEFNQQVKYQILNITSLSRLTYERPVRPILPNPSEELLDNKEAGEAPRNIKIDSVDIDVDISTPNEVSISALDAALQSGVVHYPGSGGVGGDRRMFLFGHSSRLAAVINDSYRAFNGLDDVEIGDEITVSDENGKEVIYEVTSVEIADASDRLVSLVSGRGKLTLSTCTTFGARENRVVVEAEIKAGD